MVSPFGESGFVGTASILILFKSSTGPLVSGFEVLIFIVGPFSSSAKELFTKLFKLASSEDVKYVLDVLFATSLINIKL